MLLGVMTGMLIGAMSGGEVIRVEGGQIARELRICDGILDTVSFRNTINGRVLRVTGPEFLLTYGAGEMVTSEAFRVGRVTRAASGLQIQLENAALGLRADISYTPASGASWLYKEITLTNTGAAPFLLRALEPERLCVMDESVTYAVDPAFPSLGDWGQPVYTESLWFGLEFPAARSSATREGVIFLRHHPGIELKPGASYTGKRAVAGAAETYRVQRAFMKYVETITPVPNPPRANIYWNGFRVVKPPNRAGQGVAMVDYARKLKSLTGFTFDGWTYDAGFDMYRADALFAPNEPDIWEKTREALRDVDTPLGFWTSFSPIFDTPTHAWGRTQGFELQHDASYCLAGPVYFAAIRARLEEIVRTYGMNTINFDGMYWGQGFGCNQDGHGHLVGDGAEAGVYATERVVENKQAIFETLRRINPQIVLDLFVCNEWASPWWLLQLDGVHTVAGDTLGCDIPSPWLRDELITVRDIQVFDEHRRLRRQFPLWAEDLYGTQVRSDHLIDGVVVTGEAMAARWEDEYVMALAGRGAVANHIICSDLRVLDKSAGGLKFLGEGGNWVRRNAALYRNFQLIGGEPAKRQPYGYTHGDGEGRSLIALRNPWLEPRIYDLAIDEQLDLGPVNEPVHVYVVYPYHENLGEFALGDSVSVPLQDYAVTLLEARVRSRRFEHFPAGFRRIPDESGAWRLCETPQFAPLPGGGIVLSEGDGALHLSGQVTVPDDAASATIMVMLLPGEGDVMAPTASVDDQPAPVSFHERKRNRGQDAWALIEIAPGSHTVDIRVTGRGAGQVGAWLRADYTLQPAGDAEPAPPPDLFPVYAPAADRRIAALMPVETFTLPLPPLPDGHEVALGDLRGRCVEAEVGFFHVGWDESCWPDDPVLRIGNVIYSRGLGVHAPSTVSFELEGAFARFKAEIGLHGVPPERKADKARPGSCVFLVEGDGVKLYESPLLREGDAPIPVDVPIAGVRKLTLRVTNGGDSNYDDLAAWGNARVER